MKEKPYILTLYWGLHIYMQPICQSPILSARLSVCLSVARSIKILAFFFFVTAPYLFTGGSYLSVKIHVWTKKQKTYNRKYKVFFSHM